MTHLPTTSELVKDWLAAQDRQKRAERDFQRARDDVQRAAAVLAQRIAPSDIKDGEVISVWVSTGFRQEQLVSVKKLGNDYQVTFRGESRADPDLVDREQCCICGAGPGQACNPEAHV